MRGHINYRGIAFVLLVTGVLQVVTQVGTLSDYLPSPSTIGREFVRNLFGGGSLATQLPQTLTVFAVGIGLAAAIGIVVGLCGGLSPRFDTAVKLTIELLRPLPAVALIPLLILVFGLGLQMRIITVTYAAIWPILLNTHYGVRGVDAMAVDVGRNFGLSRREIIRRIVLPSALPSLVTGLRVAATMALAVAVVAELIAGSGGLGYVIALSEQSGNVALLYSAVLLVGVLGYLINTIVVVVNRRILFWVPGNRTEKR